MDPQSRNGVELKWKYRVEIGLNCRVEGVAPYISHHTPGIHTGGREREDFPPPPPFENSPPPLLNQHKYYKKVVLKHKQQQSGSCCSKKVCTYSKTPRIFPKVYSSCQNIGNRHCFLVGGGFPPLFEKSCMKP